eukprot:TRINITY_DN948_c0_g1_i1.p1 TRINITY_DN948_c0_g1~~TRINITY_DN948_c0_g1_i1.p1  ORF type:complete len:454 (+),score=104.51 TRINITY_DN948_c0_g1_i1:232-1593(+)
MSSAAAWPLYVCCLLFGATVVALDNGLGRTPAMGWSSWNRFYLADNETIIRTMAAAIVKTGLRDAGYDHVNVDAGYLTPERDSQGRLVVDSTKFPSGMAALADYLHDLGLKLGVYTDLGKGSCGTGPGSLGYYDVDAETFASWGVDYLKVDFCGSGIEIGDDELAHWGQFSAALNKTGRPIYLSICPKTVIPSNATDNSAPYAGRVVYLPPPDWSRDAKFAVANAWLVEYVNTVDEFYSAESNSTHCVDAGGPCGIITNIDAVVTLGLPANETGPGGLVDADMLEVCQFGGTLNPGGMTMAEYRLHFYVWAVLPSPLILSFDVRTLADSHPECLAMVLNPEIIAINQDPLVRGASVLRQGGGFATTNITYQVFGRPLMSPGSFAAVLANRSEMNQTVRLDWDELGLPNPSGAAVVRDAGNRINVGSFAAYWETVVPPHDAVIVHVDAAQLSEM